MKNQGNDNEIVILFKRFICIIQTNFILLKNKITGFIIRLDLKNKFTSFLLFLKKIYFGFASILKEFKNNALEIIKKSGLKQKSAKIYLSAANFISIYIKKIVSTEFRDKTKQFVKYLWTKIIYYLAEIKSGVLRFRQIGILTTNRIITYISLLIIIDIFLLWFISYNALYAKHYWDGQEDKHFIIKSGKNVDDIIGDLKKENIIGNKLIFKIIVKLSGKEEKIPSKRYIFKNGLSNSELLNILTDRFYINEDKFTIVEGLRIKQIARLVENKLQMSKDKFIEATENDSLIKIIGLGNKIKNLEGFLFPDTYILPPDLDEKGLVEILFDEFRKKVIDNPEIKKESSSRNFNLLHIIIMASIIQGETKMTSEMPAISGVYNNRLKIRMKLEADPTVQYALPEGPKPRLLFDDLKIDSPYNTYKHYGLPPGPINNPGLFAIHAALKPDKNNYLFFVATGNGGHKFSSSYAEHLKAISEYKKQNNRQK